MDSSILHFGIFAWLPRKFDPSFGFHCLELFLPTSRLRSENINTILGSHVHLQLWSFRKIESDSSDCICTNCRDFVFIRKGHATGFIKPKFFTALSRSFKRLGSIFPLIMKITGFTRLDTIVSFLPKNPLYFLFRVFSACFLQQVAQALVFFNVISM